MPTLRWFGRSVRHVVAVDADRARRSASRSRRPCAASWSCRSRDGPEEGDELAALRPRGRTCCTTVSCPKLLRRSSISRNAMPPSCLRLAAHGAGLRDPRAPNRLIRPMQAQVTSEGDDRQRRRLVGAVGADELQVGAEGRPVQQARHGELADHDGEGEEGAAEHRRPDVGQDHRNRMVGQPAPRLSAASVSVRTSMARRPVSTARYM